MISKKFFTTGEVSQIVDISRATVSRKFDAGILRGKKNPITGERLISRESLVSFMRQYNLPLKGLEKGAEKRVLLASADKHLHFLVSSVLSQDENIKLDAVTSGYDALIMCSKTPADVLILDIELSDISCAEAIRSLRRFDLQKNMKVLCCLKTSDVDKFLEIGADDYLAKDSLNEAALATKIAQLIGAEHKAQPPGGKYDHKRRWPRVSVDIPTDLEVYRVHTPEVSEQGKASVENISLGGAYLSNIHLESGNIPIDTFRFLLNIDQPPLNNWQAECKVIRLQGNGSLTAGVQFISLSEQNKNKINGMIS